MSSPSFLQTQLFINNEYVDAKSSETIKVTNPATDEIVTDKVQVAGEADIDAAVDAATKAFKEGPWKTFTGVQRADCMNKFAELVKANASELARLETQAMGAAFMITNIIATSVPDIFKYYAGWADKIAGEQYPPDDGQYKIVSYQPLGVCAGIGAWNASLMLFAWKVAPAVAAGNTFIFKTSEKSPLGALAFGKLIKEAGFPPGVINIVSGDGKAGQLLAQHMRIAKISFTGSGATGRKVADAANKSNMKRVTMELGGKSPALVFEDADIENALTCCSQNFLLLTGQVCAAASRVYVHKPIAEKFIAGLKERFEALGKSVGADPLAPTTYIGPLADKIQFDRVMGYIESGKKEATLLTGGTRVGEKGQFIAPTIFKDPSDNAKIYKEEVFGPVGIVKTFETEEEAIRMANDTSYGLSSTLYTNSVARALRVSAAIEAGSVSVNTSHSPNKLTPFGGWKSSGYGRELGKAGLMNYVQEKTIHIAMNIGP
ncbi:MAG: hypothetical protein M1820_008850 [Bogoriella megaspora]|nr:MAG: hypothetical protein M1820_008850 [Bogoriella megaspora]